MRTTTDAQTGIILTYPDELSFAFNPFLIKAENADSISVGINIGIVRYYDVTSAAFSSVCYADLQEYLQSLFDGMSTDIDYSQAFIGSAQGLTVTISVTATSGNDTYTLSFTSYVVWGAVKPDGRDDFRKMRHIKWFKNFPFAYGLYASANNSVLIGYNDAPNSYVSINTDGIYNFGSAALLPGAKYYVIYEYGNVIQQGLFDNYFDLTFYLQQNVTQTPLLRIDVDETTDEGIYLRWIDRHGYIAHWLFKTGDEQRVIAAVREFSRNALVNYNQNYGWQRGSGRRQSMSRNDICPLCAPFVEKDVFDYLQDITTSPVVDMYIGNDTNNDPVWMGVAVQAATYTKSRDELQDFVFNLILPETPIQSL